ncbi:rod shape-determining protein RodA [Candidatus Uhrbacteria bacterium RIFCSPHIGHO2_12_FULL_47_12]|uniref:Rod shape-determining protein RodA n=1 Tax=Candidatus Uhrbacteria bacterium RIFCSPLOWO2_02_FULL_48_18 TaxID=1802408 RepID=A0A1F7V8U8_9BACT|nr:MAG: rod shape-determining protein RodA [Candidatus Uhrbacteria bacterium RIFCSPHIGHO2_12_FULL_47_12]OGL86920.1 MAG: rod shape-determining protein RodA [Candidatus Uhrbacteria bacterium RIFCSPLOWO2_02_FULL_48_18]
MLSIAHTARELVARLRSMDWVLFFSVLVLLFLGLAAIYSVDLSRDATDLINVKKQCVALLLACIIALFVTNSNYQFLEHYRLWLYIAGILLLIGVLIFGQTIRGARGWYVFGNVSFQPVEFMKAATVVMLASYFSRRARRYFGWRELVESFVIVLIPVVVVMFQPDFGSAAVLMGIWFILALFAGMPMRTLFLLCIAGVVVFMIAWFGLFAPYQKARIATFLNPTEDPLGQGYNVAQAVIAIGAGGWFGRGLGFGTQSQLKFLPESQTDFIFAVIAEELGFFGVTLLLGAFSLLFLRVGRLVRLSRDNFTTYLLLGIVALLFLQILINVGMNLGVFPVTGIGLPFVSYGGSSLVVFLFYIGVIQSIAIRTVRVTYQV